METQDFRCTVCNELKPRGYNKHGLAYVRCSDCYLQTNREFWANKRNKKCKTCQIFLPIGNFGLDLNQCPWPSCWNCFYAKSQKPGPVGECQTCEGCGIYMSKSQLVRNWYNGQFTHCKPCYDRLAPVHTVKRASDMQPECSDAKTSKVNDEAPLL